MILWKYFNVFFFLSLLISENAKLLQGLFGTHSTFTNSAIHGIDKSILNRGAITK